MARGPKGPARQGEPSLETREAGRIPALRLNQIDAETQLEQGERGVDAETHAQKAQGARPPQSEAEALQEAAEGPGPGARTSPTAQGDQGIPRRLPHQQHRQRGEEAEHQEGAHAGGEAPGGQGPGEQGGAEACARDEARPGAGAHPAELVLRHMVHDHAVAGGVEQGGEQAVQEEYQTD
jgi:hypothetical protein